MTPAPSAASTGSSLAQTKPVCIASVKSAATGRSADRGVTLFRIQYQEGSMIFGLSYVSLHYFFSTRGYSAELSVYVYPYLLLVDIQWEQGADGGPGYCWTRAKRFIHVDDYRESPVRWKSRSLAILNKNPTREEDALIESIVREALARRPG